MSSKQRGSSGYSILHERPLTLYSGQMGFDTAAGAPLPAANSDGQTVLTQTFEFARVEALSRSLADGSYALAHPSIDEGQLEQMRDEIEQLLTHGRRCGADRRPGGAMTARVVGSGAETESLLDTQAASNLRADLAVATPRQTQLQLQMRRSTQFVQRSQDAIGTSTPESSVAENRNQIPKGSESPIGLKVLVSVIFLTTILHTHLT